MKDKIVIYYPAFDSDEELTSHYYRARWYLPNKNNRLKEVRLYHQTDCKVLQCPDYMTEKAVDDDHIKLIDDLTGFEKTVEQADVVLLWKTGAVFDEKKWKEVGKRIVHIETSDINSREYGRYCSLLWDCILSAEEKKRLIEESRERFLRIAEEIETYNYQCSCVFGTGPSIDSAWEYDFSGCFCVVCNSIVQNKSLMHHINPWFITAGDVVSHLGVSKYAEIFRKDLIECLLNGRVYMITTASFGYILTEQHPEIREKIILVEQLLDVMNMDLRKSFALPKRDSTFNIHMLPLANTFGKTIYFLGCDGKNPNGDNEDFWAHSRQVQYHDLVITGHQCHPTFDLVRQQVTYNRYENDVIESLTEGEMMGKRYYALSHSYTAGLKRRRLPKIKEPVRNNDGQIIVSRILDKSNIEKRGITYQTSNKLKIAILCTMPERIYSGGRYLAWIMAEALVAVGHEVYFITNNYPVFCGDFNNYLAHERIHLIKTEGRRFNIRLSMVKKFDYAVIAPNQDIERQFYDECKKFAIRKHAKMLLINYESGNWYRHYVPDGNRDDRLWDHWKSFSRVGCLFLCSSKESMKWAKDFYNLDDKHTRFDVWSPAINSIEADRTDVEKEKRIIAFVRLTDAHKGGADLLRIACEELSGYTLVFMVGSGQIDENTISILNEIEEKYGIGYEIKHCLSDYEKFIEIKRAEYMLFPSYFEGYGYPPVEAQYCNTQCICYDLPTLREIGGDRNIYCQYGDIDDLRNKLIDCIRHETWDVEYKNAITEYGSFEIRAKELDRVLQKHRNDHYNNSLFRFGLILKWYLY